MALTVSAIDVYHNPSAQLSREQFWRCVDRFAQGDFVTDQ
jgi:hypothetical protein